MNSIEAIQNATPTNWANHDADLASRSDWNQNRYSEDRRMHVQFYLRPVLDENASNEAGRPIYRDTEFVKIALPGDKHNMIDRPVRIFDDEPRRWPEHYAQFKQGIEEQVVGTPLASVPGLTSAQIEELRAMKMRTAEQLAGAPDSIAQNFMGFQELKAKARAYLDATAGNARLNEELASRDAMIAKMQERIAALESGKKPKD